MLLTMLIISPRGERPSDPPTNASFLRDVERDEPGTSRRAHRTLAELERVGDATAGSLVFCDRDRMTNHESDDRSSC